MVPTIALKEKIVHFTLTGLKPTLSCFGTSFPSLEATFDYVKSLQSLGLCAEYSIGGFTSNENGTGRHVEVYNSMKEMTFSKTELEMIFTALRLRANWMETGIAVLSARDAAERKMSKLIRVLSDEQIELIKNLRDLATKVESEAFK